MNAPSFAGKAPYLVLSLAILVLDQWTKWLVEARIEAYEVIEVIPGLLNFIHVRNTGVAFGLFAAHGDVGATLVLAGLGLLALLFVGYYFYLTPREDRLLLLSLGLVLGGAVGNLIDRVAQHGVTDFVDFYVDTYHWHTFNVADSAISVGIVLMLLGTFRQPSQAPENAGSSQADGDAEGEDGAGPSAAST